MKTIRATFALLVTGISLVAQDAVPPPVESAVPISVRRTPEELDQLLAPIALYPDALIALILPASTVPTDIVLAARHLRDNPGDRSQIEHRAWDESVKSLTNYPEVLTWMDENLQWAQQVGEAFTQQPADVMQAVQRLRAKARAAGTLVDTPQQQVIAEPQVIRIVPAQSDVIYVPHYEPSVVFVDRPVYYGWPYLTFGVGVPVGSWLAFDCDWHRHKIWVGNRHRHWHGHDWRRPVVPIASTFNHTRTSEVRQWRPAAQVSRTTVTIPRNSRSEIVRPAPFGLATTPRTYTQRRESSRRGDSSPPPVVPALPRNFSPGFRAETTGPQPATTVVSPSIATPQLNTVPPAVPNLQPLPQARRPGVGSSRDNDNRGRNFRDSRPTVMAAPPVVPALPMATPPRSVQPAGPVTPRSFSRVESAPQIVPALPMANRSTPPPVAAGPVAPAESAPAASAPAQRSGGESRGHRGGNWSGRESGGRSR